MENVCSSSSEERCVSDDEELKKILQGCTAFRPNLTPTWEAIGRIPLKESSTMQKFVSIENGAEEFIPKLVLFSFDGENPVPLVEELVEKGWQIGSGSNHRITPEQIEKLLNTFQADPVQLIKDFVTQHPKVLFAGILPRILRRSDEQVRDVLKSDGDKFIYRTSQDESRAFFGGMSALTLMILWKQSSPETLKTLIERSGEENLVDAQDHHGRTALHWCAVLRRYEELSAILPFSPNLDIKANHGGTALDFAVERGYKNIQTLLRGSSDKSEDSQLLKTSLKKKGLLDFLPTIYEPSSGNIPQDVSIAVLRFLERQFPEMLKEGSSLVIIPPEFPKKCPFTEEGRKKGWEAEKAAHEKMKSALQKLSRKYSNQKFLFCSGLRYSVTFQDKGTTMKKEWEIDGILLTHGEVLGGIIQEIKCGKKGRNILRSTGPEQLDKHIQFLGEKLNCNAGFLKKNLVTPNCPANKVSDEKFQTNLASKGMIGLTRGILNDCGKLCQWLETHLGLSDGQPTTSPEMLDDYAKVFAWALVTTMGVVAPHIAQNLEEHTSKSEHILALLTTVQFQALHLTPQSPADVPTVIFGGFGSGKSFLAERKIHNLHQQGIIGTESRLIYISPGGNRAFNMVLKTRMKPLKGVQFVGHCNGMADIMKVLYQMDSDCKHIKFLIIDQFENYLTLSIDEEKVSDFWKIIKNLSRKMDLVWLLVNPRGLQADVPFIKFKELVDKDCAVGSTCLTLDTTVRNTQAVCNVMETINMFATHGKLQPLLTKPCAIAGAKIESVHYQTEFDPYLPEEQRMTPLESMASTAAHELHGYILGKNIESKEIIVIHDIRPLTEKEEYKQFITHLDKKLVEEFPEVKKERLLSLAPVLIHSPTELLTDMATDLQMGKSLELLEYVQKALDKGKSTEGLQTLMSSLQSFLTNENPCIVEDVVRGILLRMVTLKGSKPSLDEKIAGVLAKLKIALQSSGGHQELKEFFDVYRFVGIHHWEFVDGYESNVVVGVIRQSGFTCYRLVRSVSRAKVMGTMITSAESRTWMEGLFKGLLLFEDR